MNMLNYEVTYEKCENIIRRKIEINKELYNKSSDLTEIRELEIKINTLAEVWKEIINEKYKE